MRRVPWRGCQGPRPSRRSPQDSAGRSHQLAHRNNGKYPSIEVENAIEGGGVFLAHGTKDMPVWGPIFSVAGNQPLNGKLRVYALTKYIEQFQAR
jgi:hypothetical protein